MPNCYQSANSSKHHLLKKNVVLFVFVLSANGISTMLCPVNGDPVLDMCLFQIKPKPFDHFVSVYVGLLLKNKYRSYCLKLKATVTG